MEAASHYILGSARLEETPALSDLACAAAGETVKFRSADSVNGISLQEFSNEVTHA